MCYLLQIICCGSHVSTCLVSRSIDSFGSVLTFQRCVYSEQLWKIEIVSLWGRRRILGGRSRTIKIMFSFETIKIRFAQLIVSQLWHNPLCVQHPLRLLHIAVLGIEAEKKTQTVQTCSSCYLMCMSNEVLCLWLGHRMPSATINKTVTG